MRRKIIIALYVVFAAIFVFSAVNFCLLYMEYQKAEAIYEDMQNQYVSLPAVNPTEPLDAEETKEKAPVSADFEGLWGINPDVVGWIYAPDIEINYPVVQATDNQYYLHKGLDKEYLRSGTIFADYRNGEPTVDRNYIIYGHNMKNGSMFGSLVKYKEQDYYDQYPVWYYLTPEQNYRIELFAGCVVNTNHIVYQTNPDDEEFYVYLQNSMKRSTFQSDVTIAADDAIITLSTCSYEFDQARYVVMGKLIPIQ